MKSKQEIRAPAKQATPAGKVKVAKTLPADAKGNAKKTSALSSSSSKSDFDDVADLFSAIKQTKAQQKGGGVAAGASTHPAHSSGKDKKHTKAGKGSSSAAVSSSSPSSSSPAVASNAVVQKPVRDGLYHAPQKSVQMSDNDFFSGTWLKADQAAATGSVVAGGSAEPAEASQEQLRKEGVDRIVSMEELSKMLSRNARAGTTPNCPFDCDCCF